MPKSTKTSARSATLLERLRIDAAGLRVLDCKAGSFVWRAGDAVDHGLFPLEGLFALQSRGPSGDLKEVETRGPQGAFGILEALSGRTIAFDCVALTAGRAALVPARTLREILENDETAQGLWRYLADAEADARQMVHCHAHHRLSERLPDLLAAYAANAQTPRIAITQEGVAACLGVTRSTATIEIGRLAKEGLLTNGRGWIRLVRPADLDRQACGCRRRAG